MEADERDNRLERRRDSEGGDHDNQKIESVGLNDARLFSSSKHSKFEKADNEPQPD